MNAHLFYGYQVIACFLVLCQLTGCATILNRQNSKRDVFFDANVPGVQITCGGGTTTTPGAVYLKISKTHNCVASKEGYEEMPIKVRAGLTASGVATSTGLNLLIGIITFGAGLILGWGVDLASGAMRNFKKDKFFIEMIPLEKSTLLEKGLPDNISAGKSVVSIPNKVARQISSGSNARANLSVKEVRG